MNALRGSRSPDPLALLPESAPCGQQNFDLALPPGSLCLCTFNASAARLSR
jgi:hypothetical protein